MGWIDRLLGKKESPLLRGETTTPYPYDTYDPAQRVLPVPYEPYVGIPGQKHPSGLTIADPGVPLSWAYKGQVERIWRSQPNVRKVIDFIARNVAGIPLHTYERVSDTDRKRVTDHPISRTLSLPRLGTSPFRFWHSVISDGLLYDAWAVLMVPGADGSMELVQVPSWRLRLEVDGLRRVTAAAMWTGDKPTELARGTTDDQWQDLPLDMLIFDHGYSPTTAGLSPMVTLADILAESSEAIAYRRQLWDNGARVPTFITRPVDAPEWSKEARQRFKRAWQEYQRNGSRQGGTPLLEDGMRLETVEAFKPQDTMDIEGRRLTSIEVASAFHIAPEMVGARQGNYSNMREFRQSLYRDSLGPYIQAWEQTVQAQLVPRMETSGRDIYVEANVESKLRGSFEEQAQLLSSAIGAPWMTRSEGRARMNLPHVEGSDELVVPLNVLVGGQASPRDSGDQNRGLASRRKARVPAQYKARPPESYTTQARRALEEFFGKQGRSIVARITAGDNDWWDAERWDKELADLLYRLSVLMSTYVGEKTAKELGFEPGDYNVERTLNYLKAVAERIAEQTNETTREQVASALEEDDEETEPLQRVDHVFEVAVESRAEQSSTTFTTTFTAFAAAEAARQTVGSRATKTWIVTSANPRASHAMMNGETVGIDEKFSNGMEYPGSIEGGPDEVAGCQCELQINLP